MGQPRSTPVTIDVSDGTADEQQTRELLLHLFNEYPLDKWRYTEAIRIEAGVIPHSHPILTLNTQHKNHPEQLLTDYLHEQLHWFSLLDSKSSVPGQAIAEIRAIYPNLPIALPQGCGSASSNYLHVLICYLEYSGLCELLGVERARAILGQKRYYTAIYAIVLDDTARIAEIVERYGEIPPERPPANKTFRRAGP